MKLNIIRARIHVYIELCFPYEYERLIRQLNRARQKLLHCSLVQTAAVVLRKILTALVLHE